MSLAQVAKFTMTIPQEPGTPPRLNDLRLFLLEDADGGRVILFGDRDKLVFQGDVEKARKVYSETVAHYLEREKEEGA